MPPRVRPNAPGAEDVASVRTGEALVYGEASFVTAVTPNAGASINLDWKDGSQAVFADLGADGAFVDEDFADDHNLTVGSPISITTPAGKKLDLTVKGIFDPPAGGSPFGNVTFSSETFDANYDQPQNLYSFVDDGRRRDRLRTPRLSRHRWPTSRTPRPRRARSSRTTRSPS